ncbi:MAG TPA: hypothetical protein VM925_31405, partial [Labilithrix sp.]|nr:hypothetical protein [Labilithrix sp.]
MTTRLEHLTSLIWRAKAHCPADLWSAMRENVEALAATDSVGKTAESQKNSSDDSRSKPVLPKVPDAEKIAARLRIYDLVDESARGALIWNVSVLMKEACEEVRVEERARAAAYAADEIAYAQRPSDAVPPECAVNPVLSRVCVKGTKSCALTHEHDVPRTPEAWDDHGGRPVNPDPTQGPWTDKAAAPERDWKTIAEGLMVALETGERLDALRARFGLKPALPHSPRLQGERSVEFSDALPEGWDIISKDNGTAYCLEGPWFNTRREAIASLPRSANPVPDVDEVVRVAAKLCSFHPCRCEDAYTARGRHAPGCMYVELEDLREALARRRASRSQAVELHCDSCDDDPRLGPRLPSEMTHCAGCYAVLESHYGAALKRVADLSEELAFERDSKRPVATLSTICPK